MPTKKTATPATSPVTVPGTSKYSARTRYKSKTKPDAPERYEQQGLIVFRAPIEMWDFITWLSKAPHLGYRTVSRLLTDSVVEFLTTRPWTHGFQMKEPKSPTSKAGNTGFKQCNAILDSATLGGKELTGAELKEKVRQACEIEGFTMSSLMYSVLWWIVTVKHRSEAGLQ